MTTQAPFAPNYGSGVTVSPTITAASLTFSNKTKSVVLTNFSTSIVCYVRIGSSGTVATMADYPVLPSTQIVLSKSDDNAVLSYVTASGTGSLHVMAGEGY
jgi:hypothetical protein